MVIPVFEINYLKDNESNYTLRNHKSCQWPWHGQRQKFKSVLRNLHDVEMGHYTASRQLQPLILLRLKLELYLRYFPLLLYQTATLVNFIVGSKPFSPL